MNFHFIKKLTSVLLCSIGLTGTSYADSTGVKMDKTLKPEQFIRSFGDGKEIGDQVMEPSGPESKSKIYITNNSHLAIDSNGNIYVTGPRWVTNEGFAANGITKISPAGVATPVHLDISARIDGITVDIHDNIYLSERYFSPSNAGRGGSEYSMFPALERLWAAKGFSRIYKLTLDGKLKSLLGKSYDDIYTNFSVNNNGIVYVGSYLGLKKIDPSFFGSTKSIIRYDHHFFSEFDEANPKTEIFYQPSISRTAIDSNDNLFYVERYDPQVIESQRGTYHQPHAIIMRYSRDGKLAVLAGINKSIGAVDGVSVDAGFEELAGLCIDGKGNLYTAEKKAQTIRRIDPRGSVITIATNIGNDVLDVATHGNSLYILRKTGLDIINNIDTIP